MRLRDKVAIVTGAAGVLGRAMIERFSEEGASVVVTDIDELGIDRFVDRLRQDGKNAIGYRVDVTNPEDFSSVVDAVLSRFGQIDILVNNAGATRQKPFRQMHGEDWDYVVDVNLKGAFYGIRAVADHMISRRYGKILNISSSGSTGAGGPHTARNSWSGNVNYQTAKAGVNQLTKTFARELGPFGVNVNAIANGCLGTTMGTTIRTREQEDEHLRQVKGMNVLGMAGVPVDTAHSALFLVSDEARFITGQVLNVDGGINDRM